MPVTAIKLKVLGWLNIILASTTHAPYRADHDVGSQTLPVT
jgi:hypothetical protein